jgi:hypothetical protein
MLSVSVIPIPAFSFVCDLNFATCDFYSEPSCHTNVIKIAQVVANAAVVEHMA